MRTTSPNQRIQIWDDTFESEMYLQVQEAKNYYEQMRYRDVIREGFFDLQGVKENYKINCASEGYRRDLILK